MSTAVQTAKMIYADQTVAAQILDKLNKRDAGKSYALVKIPSGWQVAPVTVCTPYMPPAKPVPVNNLTFATANSTNLDAVAFEFVFSRETKMWLYFVKDDGTEGWVHKNKVISKEYAENAQGDATVRFKLSKKEAQKLGLWHDEVS